MKIQAIADTHGSNFVDQLEPCDLLLIGGDISPIRCNHSYLNQKQWFRDTFIPQLEEIQKKELAKYIVFIAGNHDRYLYEMNIEHGNSKKINELLPENVHYLCDELIDIEGIKIYGAPWCVCPSWANPGGAVWNFARLDKELIDIYAGMPNDIDILLTHGPCYGLCDAILDQVIHSTPRDVNYKPEHLGSLSLKTILHNRKHKPLYVLSGHIHSAERKVQVKDVVGYSCVSILNEQYQFSDDQKPFVFDIAKKNK